MDDQVKDKVVRTDEEKAAFRRRRYLKMRLQEMAEERKALREELKSLRPEKPE